MNITKKLPIILQDELAECGHACIAMISNFFGHKLDLADLRHIQKPSPAGTTLKQIINILEKLQFKTRALKIPIDTIRYIKTPALLHWNMNHFVVLKKVKKNKVIIHDPAIGAISYNLNEFSKSFTGIILEVEKPISFKKIQKIKKLTIYKIIKHTPKFYKILWRIITISTVIEFFTILNPLFLQYTTDQILISNDLGTLYITAIGFVILILIQILAEYTRENLILYTTMNFMESFGSNVFQHLLKLPISFFSNRHQGDIQSKFQSINHIKSTISNDFINAILDGLMFILIISVMLIYNWILTSIVVCALIVYIGMRYISYHSLKNSSASSIFLQAKLANKFLEAVRAITPIKVFLKEKTIFNSWQNTYIDTLNTDIKINKQQIIYKVSNHLLFNIEHIIIICVGAHLIAHKKLSIGMLLAFLTYRLMLVNKASALIQNTFDYKLLSIHLQRLSDIILQKIELPQQNYKKIIPDTITSLSLENIGFQYNKDEKFIIKDLNLDIKQGEKIAIIGKSGCGKSTLLKIMMGLLQPTNGKIYINNIPMNTFGIDNYRLKIAAVMQEDQLLSGSILDNIAFFDEEIDIERIYFAAQVAQIHNTINKLTMGYETLINDMGSILSGGQKQRIFLARAIYKNPSILFLDEATSHLDNNNEKLINEDLKKMNITQIIVAHREETIKMADKIYQIPAIL